MTADNDENHGACPFASIRLMFVGLVELVTNSLLHFAHLARYISIRLIMRIAFTKSGFTAPIVTRLNRLMFVLSQRLA